MRSPVGLTGIAVRLPAFVIGGGGPIPEPEPFVNTLDDPHYLDWVDEQAVFTVAENSILIDESGGGYYSGTVDPDEDWVIQVIFQFTGDPTDGALHFGISASGAHVLGRREILVFFGTDWMIQDQDAGDFGDFDAPLSASVDIMMTLQWTNSSNMLEAHIAQGATEYFLESIDTAPIGGTPPYNVFLLADSSAGVDIQVTSVGVSAS